MPGFGSFAGGFAQGFLPALHQQQELQLRRQQQQMQAQRELMARSDEDRGRLWQTISEHAKAMLAAGDSPDHVAKAMQHPLSMLERLTRSSGHDASLIAPEFGMILQGGSSLDIVGRGQQRQPAPQQSAFDQGGSAPMPFMGNQGQPGTTPDMRPSMTAPNVGIGGDDLTGQIDQLTRAMSIAETPGLKEAYKIRLHELVRRQAQGEHIQPMQLKDGTVILINKNKNIAFDLNGHQYIPPARDGNDDISQIADAIESGNQPPKTTGLYGKGPSVRAELQRRKFNLAKADLEYKSAERQVLSLNGPQMERFRGLADSVSNTIDEVRELSKEMDLSGVKAANWVELQELMNVEGDSPAGQLATQYVTAINTLKEEFSNLAQGGYAPTESVWKLANDQINSNFGRKQLDAAVSEIQRLINYRIKAIPNFGTLGPGSSNRYVPGQGEPAVAPRSAPGLQPTIGGKTKNGIEWELH